MFTFAIHSRDRASGAPADYHVNLPSTVSDSFGMMVRAAALSSTSEALELRLDAACLDRHECTGYQKGVSVLTVAPGVHGGEGYLHCSGLEGQMRVQWIDESTGAVGADVPEHSIYFQALEGCPT